MNLRGYFGYLGVGYGVWMKAGEGKNQSMLEEGEESFLILEGEESESKDMMGIMPN